MALNISEITEQLNKIESSLEDGVTKEEIELLKYAGRVIDKTLALGERFARSGMNVSNELDRLKTAKNSINNILREFDR